MKDKELKLGCVVWTDTPPCMCEVWVRNTGTERVRVRTHHRILQSRRLSHRIWCVVWTDAPFVYYESRKRELKKRPMSRAKEKTYIWVSLWWKTKNKNWEIWTPRIHWVGRGTGTPKDKDEVNRRDVCECDGWVCVFEVIDIPSTFKRIRKVAVLGRVWSSKKAVSFPMSL